MSVPEFRRHPDLTALVEAARQEFVDLVVAAQAAPGDGLARVVLTGGGAGIALLEAVRRDSGAIDWTRVLVFFGDERFVPADSPDRNIGQARQALLDHVDIRPERVLAIAASDEAFGSGPNAVDAAAADYASRIAEAAPEGFDVHLLGMGPEGHINSLFPHSPAVAAGVPAVIGVRDCPKPPPTRVSLTLPEIGRADQVMLLVAGAGKAEAVRGIADGLDPVELPAAGARGRLRTVVHVDAAAAALL